MQQQPPQLMAMNPSFPPTNITTEQIQKCLDENKNLILAILDNQNLGKLAECAQYQAQLQKNLMYLAAIADGQPQAPAMHSQMAPHPMMQQGGHYMQNPQAAVPQQPGVFAPKVPLQFNTQQMQDHQLQLQQQQQRQLHHQQAIQGHLGMRPGANNGMHPMTTHGHGGSSDAPPSAAALNEFTRRTGGGGSSVDVRGTKQDAPETGSGDAQGNPAAGHGGVEPLYVKGSEGAN